MRTADRNYQLALGFDPTETILVPSGQIKLPIVAGGPGSGLRLQLPSSWTGRTRSLMFRLKLSKAGATSSEVTINQILFRSQVPLDDSDEPVEGGGGHEMLAHEPAHGSEAMDEGADDSGAGEVMRGQVRRPEQGLPRFDSESDEDGGEQQPPSSPQKTARQKLAVARARAAEAADRDAAAAKKNAFFVRCKPASGTTFDEEQRRLHPRVYFRSWANWDQIRVRMKKSQVDFDQDLSQLQVRYNPRDGHGPLDLNGHREADRITLDYATELGVGLEGPFELGVNSKRAYMINWTGLAKYCGASPRTLLHTHSPPRPALSRAQHHPLPTYLPNLEHVCNPNLDRLPYPTGWWYTCVYPA